ncbi:hypothetical protein M569_17642 [Genlisea aurea]|uniref:Uncharacterized protein n=1 Tax=Genlisea aurea TaxID=192259 RepID=S8BRY4_9LAMI|nr:hypothetical protein M569_17642 [Genlisea aurea]
MCLLRRYAKSEVRSRNQIAKTQGFKPLLFTTPVGSKNGLRNLLFFPLKLSAMLALEQSLRN